MVNDSNPNIEWRFILIDDSPFDAKLIEMSLRASLACHVIVIGSRKELLAELHRALPDAIITDPNLRSFDGPTALALARQYCPEVPIVFCSGVGAEEMKATASALGVTAWSSKDDLDHLVAVVRNLCRERVVGGE